MHKLSLPQMPAGFAEACAAFVQDYPPAQPHRTESARWEAFKNTQQAAYAALKRCLYANQYGLCAFCEGALGENNHQIEHFIPKSMTRQTQDYTLDFTNLLMSCKGYEHLPKEDQSCGNKKGNIDPQGRMLTPYDLPEFPLVAVHIDSNGLTLIPDEEACARARIAPALVQSTLDGLGLNSPNLRRRRYKVWTEVLKDINELADDETWEQEMRLLADDHLLPKEKNAIPHKEPFYTTRLLCFARDLPNLIPHC